jgi:uncharacterized protein YcfJ
MKINKTQSILATTLLTLMFSTSALAKGRYARVVDVEPVYRYVTISAPPEVCRAPIHHKRYRSGANTVAGAVIGGTLGHVMGKNSRNRQAATIAGVVIGSVIGHELGEHNNTRKGAYTRYSNRHQQVSCVNRYERSTKVKQLEGYEVSYRFRGKHFQTFMHKHPGKKVYVSAGKQNGQNNNYAYQQSKHSSHSTFPY